jgi:hypothetical protein
MPSSYASLFDDLLANNEKQMKEIMGGESTRSVTRPKTSLRAEQASRSTKKESPSGHAESSTISGTANGVPFKLIL